VIIFLGTPKIIVIIMKKENISLLDLSYQKNAKITRIIGGIVFQNRLACMGILVGREIKIVSKQPFRGPLTVEVCGCMMTIGRGMAQKILVEVIK
jgi:ferrous iron transport protein A